MSKIKIGISSCLMGEEVRFNGGHKHSSVCTNELAEHFEFRPSCPEVGIGMGVPRKPIRLVGNPNQPRAVGVDNPDLDYTEQLNSFAHNTLPEIEDLSGYIFMKGSPSCGVFRVKVYRENGMPNERAGSGIFAKAIMENNPLLPVEEAGRLSDPVLKENFVNRVYAYSDWQRLNRGDLSMADLINFHSRYKYTLMSHCPKSCSELGRMLAGNCEDTTHDLEELAHRYIELFMQTLTRKATRKTNTNVLMHLQGYLKKKLDRKQTESLSQVIEQYRLGVIPIIVPVSLMKGHFHSHPNDYIASQSFLSPYPETLSLRNRI